MLLCDTGVLLAAGNTKDQAHRACIRLLREAKGPLLVPSPVMGEIGAVIAYRVDWFRASPPEFGEHLREGPALVVASSRGLQTR
jgi:predicted nucleic acid-binding protein